jgi:DNA-directed RNA polymerase specialized sigma24 family protein
MREEGFAHHEIADAVGTTTGSVGTMIARALNKLAGELASTSESLR